MKTKIKIWKPGQLVTINHKVYRVVKNSFGCTECADIYTSLYNTPCAVCMCHKLISNDTALEELKPKQ